MSAMKEATSASASSSSQPVRILIVGAGAVGCFYGSRMHHPPNALVSLVCRSNYNAIKRSSGGCVKLRTRNFGDYIFNPEFVFSSIEEASEVISHDQQSSARQRWQESPDSSPDAINNSTSLIPSSFSSSSLPSSPSPTSPHGPASITSTSTIIPTPTPITPRTPDNNAPRILPLPTAHITSRDTGNQKRIIWDYVVITTKALPDISDDSSLITHVVHPFRTAIVLIQNGVGVEEPYHVRFPENCVLSAVTVVSAEQIEPGVIVQNRWTRISVGPYDDIAIDGGGGGRTRDGGEGIRRTREFVALLKRGGIKDAEVYSAKALQQVRWHKIAINGSMNPSAVLSSGMENARMVKDPEIRLHLKACMEEVFHAAHVVLGEPLPFNSHLATADQIITSTERNTGGRPSMLVDWEKGHPMELEVILGNPIRMARAKGVEMPRLQAMYTLLKAAQKERRGRKDDHDKRRDDEPERSRL